MYDNHTLKKQKKRYSKNRSKHFIMNNIKLFESKKIRSEWNEEEGKWYFSIIDIVEILTDQPHYQGARNYWKVMKSRLLKEGNEPVTNCNRLKLVA